MIFPDCGHIYNHENHNNLGNHGLFLTIFRDPKQVLRNRRPPKIVQAILAEDFEALNLELKLFSVEV